MKIAILADPLDSQSAGVYTYTKNLIEALSTYDSRNEYLVVREKVDPNLKLPQLAIPNVKLPIGFASFRLFFIIPFILRFKKVDAVFEPAHFGPFNLPGNVQRITMIHDLTPILFPKFHKFDSQLLQRLFLKRILKKSDIILTNSNNSRHDIHTKFPFTKSKVKTILLGRDSSFYPVKSKDHLKKFEIHHPYFLYTGTIEPRKNLTLLLDAYEQFRASNTQKIQLVVTGKKGWKTKSFFKHLEKHPLKKDIVVTGYVDKETLRELYSHAIALVYPSLYEGFGLPVLEALSSGTQVICSNNSSLPEVAEEVGLYFDPTSLSELVEQMNRAWLNFKEKKVDTNQLLKQAQKFSWERYIEEFDNILAQLDSSKRT